MYGLKMEKSTLSLNQFLQDVTTEKINTLKQQRDLMIHYFDNLEAKFNEIHRADKVEALRFLYEGLKDAPAKPQGIRAFDPDTFIAFAEDDVSLSDKIVDHWVGILQSEMRRNKKKFEYSFIFGRILANWFEQSASTSEQNDAWDDVGNEYSDIRNEESDNRSASIRQLQDIIHAPADFDGAAFKKFLEEELLAVEDIEVRERLDSIRKGASITAEFLEMVDLESHHVKLCIDGLLAQGLMNEEKSQVLRQLRENTSVLSEIASLLTSRLRTFASWEWPNGEVLVDVRRSILGKYRAYYDEDIITALFLHYVGVSWSVIFRREFMNMYQSTIWKRVTNYSSQSIEAYRQQTHSSSFLSVMPRSLLDQGAGYDEDNLDSAKGVDVKQSLLHLVATEARLHQTISPNQSFTVVRTDIEWFGPSIPHDAIRIIMEFFGVPQPWIRFFVKYLSTPLAFSKQDTPQMRLRGVPISHVLSVLFGESILFLMDLYVNQTSQLNIYRVHDDFWFWDKDETKVIRAWESMEKYAKMVCLKLNLEKSGSAAVCPPSHDNNESLGGNPIIYGKAPLPQSPPRWGFISFHSDGVFRIEQTNLGPRIAEMKDRLSKAKSVMSWVNVYNRFMSFFVRNFGKPANVFGAKHLDDITRTIKYIHDQVFTGTKGNPIEAIKSQFDILRDAEVMEMWAYWPIKAGGLGLVNPLISIILLKQRMNDAAEKGFSELPAKDINLWNARMKEKQDGNVTSPPETVGWDFRSVRSRRQRVEEVASSLLDTWEGYCGARESHLIHWREVFVSLMSHPVKIAPSILDADINSSLERIFGDDPPEDVKHYASQLLIYYGNQIGQAFGGLEFVNKDLIPLNLIQSFRRSSISWGN